MKIAAKKINGKSSSTARVVDGKLILSFPEALNPVVWQMDLVQAKASALEVREGSKGSFVLVLKTPKSETTEIAPFGTKDQAVEALMAAAGALENAHGQIRPVGIASAGRGPATTEKKKSKWAASILGLTLIAALFVLWGASAPRAPVSGDNEGLSPNPAMNFGAGGGEENGVPLSADEFLMKHRPQ